MEGILSRQGKILSYRTFIVLAIIILICESLIFGLFETKNSQFAVKENVHYTHKEKYDNSGHGMSKNQILENQGLVLIRHHWVDKKIKKYIDIDNDEQVNKTLEIYNNTPLDILTSSIIVHYSEKLDIPIPLLLAVIELESNFKQYEVGKAKDRGYCQIIPSTEKWLADTYGNVLGLQYDPKKIFEPEYNIGLGALYLHHLKKAYNNNYHRILSEYNRGPYNLKEYYNKYKTYETTYSRVVLEKVSKYNNMFAVDSSAGL
ncbi:MAG: hypothetical protein PWP27_679 [Clostridiales bacterium]|jgi:hypothetical protein|nr:hypothetical protein [Clostridiales bacterium]MDK2932869.1 hypothetical protein [Clostridiales bacterium]